MRYAADKAMTRCGVVIFALLAATSAWLLWLVIADEEPVQLRAEDSELASTSTELREGEKVPRTLGGASSHFYHLDLAAGDYIELVVDQIDVDVTVRVADPFARTALLVDSPNGTMGPEWVFLWADAPGRYMFEVGTSGRTGGSYRVLLVTRRVGVGPDSGRAKAASLFAEGESKRRHGSDPSRYLALAAYEAAFTEWLRIGDHLWAAEALERSSRVLVVQGRDTDAIDALQQAIRLLADEPKTVEIRGRVLLQLFQIFLRDRRWPEASATCDDTITLARANGARHLEAKALNNLALVNKLEGRYYESILLYNQALELWHRLGDSRREAVTRSNLGELLTALGQHRRALTFLTSAMELARQHGSVQNRARTLMSYGRVRRRLGDGSKSKQAYLEALTLYSSRDDPEGVAEVLLGLGQTRTETDDLDEAERDLREAESIFLAHGDAYRAAIARLNLGWLEDRRARPDAAGAHFRAAYATLRFQDDPAGLVSTLFGLARSSADQDRLEEAITYLRRALNLVESLRSAARTPWLKASYLDRKYDYYVFQVELLMRRHEGAPEAGFDRKAWQASERARARSALDLMRASKLDAQLQSVLTGADPAGLIDVQQTSNLAPQSSPSGVEEAWSLPRLWSARLGDTERSGKSFDLQHLRSMLLEDMAFLGYTLGKRRSFLWWITPQVFEVHPLPERDQITNLVHEARRSLQDPQPSDQRQEVALAKLSRILLEPIAEQLDGQHLVIVPDGALHFLPFAALPSLNGGDVRPRPPLVTNHRISRVKSGEMLALIRQDLARRKGANRTLAVVADPVFAATDLRFDQVTNSASRVARPGRQQAEITRAAVAVGVMKLARLPGTAAEAKMIAGFAPGDEHLILEGFNAARATLLQGAVSGFRIVHFATHGWVQERHPDLSGLVLSLFDRGGRPIDGLLRAHEIYGLRLQADLIVLSACRTALGVELRGEGLVGLTQAFQFAGAAAVLVSLWDVDDNATATFMAHFYSYLLRSGQSPSEALRAAQLALQEQHDGRWADPFYWAAFVLDGDWLTSSSVEESAPRTSFSS